MRRSVTLLGRPQKNVRNPVIELMVSPLREFLDRPCDPTTGRKTTDGEALRRPNWKVKE
jgi:hypothetical protein